MSAMVHPARLHIECPQRLSRGLVLVKWWLLAFPQYLIIGLVLGGGTLTVAPPPVSAG